MADPLERLLSGTELRSPGTRRAALEAARLAMPLLGLTANQLVTVRRVLSLGQRARHFMRRVRRGQPVAGWLRNDALRLTGLEDGVPDEVLADAVTELCG
jgi:hypothetical protein